MHEVFQFLNINSFPKVNHTKYQIPFKLGSEVDSKLLKNIDALIHCAYDQKLIDWEQIDKVNVQGSMKLFNSAVKSKISKIIFISTMSAYEKNPSLYSKAKLLIEKHAIKAGAIIIRTGLIYGEGSRGMLGSLEKAVKLLPVLPLPGLGKFKLYLTNINDLGNLIKDCIEESTIDKTNIYIAAKNKVFTFKKNLQILAIRNKLYRIFIPVTMNIILIPFKLVERIGIKLGFRSDSLISLVNQNPSPVFNKNEFFKTNFESSGKSYL